ERAGHRVARGDVDADRIAGNRLAARAESRAAARGHGPPDLTVVRYRLRYRIAAARNEIAEPLDSAVGKREGGRTQAASSSEAERGVGRIRIWIGYLLDDDRPRRDRQRDRCR